MTAARRHVAALTGLRAIAAFLVVMTHAFYWSGHYGDDTLGYIGARLEVGVPVFFVLSGYLLFRPWVRARRTGAPLPGTGRYLWRRARRVLPAYWIVVTAVFLVYLGLDADAGGRGWEGYVRSMTLTQNFGEGHVHDALSQMWSISVEMSYYLLLPLFGWVAMRLTGRARTGTWRMLAVVLAVAAVSPLWIWATHTRGFYSMPGIDAAHVDLTAQIWVPSYIGWFAGGMALAVVEPALRARGMLDGRFRSVRTAAFLALAAGAFAAACTPLAGAGMIMPLRQDPALVKNALYTVVALCAVAPLVLAPSGRQGLYSRMLAWRPVEWLGEISYELYLVHLLAMALMIRAVGYTPFAGSILELFAITAAASVPLAWGLARLTQPGGLALRAPRRRGPTRRAPRSPDPAAGPELRETPGAHPRQCPVAENSPSTPVASDRSMP